MRAASTAAASCVLAIAAVLTLFPSPVHADGASAQTRFREGVEAMRAGQLARARTAFEDSLADVPRPATAFNLALVLEAMGNPRGAEVVLIALTTGEFGTLSAEGRAEAEGVIERARLQVAELRIEHDGGAGTIVRVDGERVLGTTRLNPGPHVVTVTTADERFAETNIDLAAGAHRSLVVPLPPPGLGRGSERRVRRSPWLWIGVALAIAGAGLAIGLTRPDRPQPVTDEVWPTVATLQVR